MSLNGSPGNLTVRIDHPIIINVQHGQLLRVDARIIINVSNDGLVKNGSPGRLDRSRLSLNVVNVGVRTGKEGVGDINNCC